MLSLNGKIKSNTKEICDHTTSGNGSYTNNDTKKFKIFVANRMQQIHEGSNINQWRYVPSKINPADYASCGIDANKNTSSSK